MYTTPRDGRLHGHELAHGLHPLVHDEGEQGDVHAHPEDEQAGDDGVDDVQLGAQDLRSDVGRVGFLGQNVS